MLGFDLLTQGLFDTRDGGLFDARARITERPVWFRPSPKASRPPSREPDRGPSAEVAEEEEQPDIGHYPEGHEKRQPPLVEEHDTSASTI